MTLKASVDLPLLVPDWPAPASVMAASTTRAGGCSQAPRDSLNLAHHVGDLPASVKQNRQRLREQLQLPAEPCWLDQVHGTIVVDAAVCQSGAQADASYAEQPGAVCAVMTADCLPVLFCNRQGNFVAAAHAGWRGLVDGVLEAVVQQYRGSAGDLLVWLGPAISVKAFEVGPEVRDRFCAIDAAAAAAFRPGNGDRWYADIYQLARQRLTRLGIEQVWGGDHCTWQEKDRFYSYRRESVTGRQASLIWLK